MTALASNALTSLADVKENLSIASADTTHDNLITRKINQASQQIENYCERVFKAATYTELINGSMIDELVLNQRPVNSVTSLEYRTTGANIDDWLTIDTNFYFLDSNAGILKADFGLYGRWDRWRVVYNAGYTTIPSDLAEACATLATHYYNHANPRVNVRSRQEGQRREDYYQGITGFKELLSQLGIEQVIDGYANWPLRNE